MNKRKPTIIDSSVNENRAVLTLKVDADIINFQGDFAGMEVLKFQEPILPGSTS